MDLKIGGGVFSLSIFLGGGSADSEVIRGLLDVRRKQSALELLAILRLLREGGSPQSQEPERVLRTLSPATFTRLWSSPAAFLWTRLAYGFMRAGGRDPMALNFADWIGVSHQETLPALMERLWLLIIAGLLIEQRDYQLDEPISLPPMGSLSTLGIAWQATSHFWIVGVCPQGLQLQDRYGRVHVFAVGASLKGLEIIPQPSLMTGASLYLDVWSEAALASFHGLERADRVSACDEVACQVEVLRSALSEIRSVLPGIHEEIGLLLQIATPLKKRFPGLPSSSNSALTGAIWFTQTDEPALLAEMLIHEHSHNKLFLLQDVDPLLDPGRHGTGWEGARHYSPWRDDPRPLNAIVHAYYVFSEAALFWARRLSTTPSEALSLRRFGMLVRQLQSARMVLEEHAAFTALGNELMRLLGLRLDIEFIPLVEELGTDDLMAFHMESNNILELDPAASIAAAVRSHRQQWEVRLAAHASSDHAHI